MVPQAESPCNDYTEDRCALGHPLHPGRKAIPVIGRILLGHLAGKRFGAEVVTWPEMLLRLLQNQTKDQYLAPRRKKLVNICENISISINLKPLQLL